MITAYAYQDARGSYVHYDDIDFREDGAYHKSGGEKLLESGAKMSKALKNVVNPDRIIEQYGADTLRLYEMYMGPLEASKPWNTRDIIGVHRFLQRVWRLVIQPVNEAEPEGEWRLNTKISAIDRKRSNACCTRRSNASARTFSASPSTRRSRI